MARYLVEGVYFPRAKTKKAMALEPFARAYWAGSAQEAIRLATEDLQGGTWQKPPRASQTSEEQRMRQQGQPELPGFDSGAFNLLQSGKKKVSVGKTEANTRSKKK